MSKKINLKVVTPEKLILEELVDEVILPTEQGQIAILVDHIPLVAKLKSGDIVALSNGEEIPIAVVGGFVEVNKNGNENTNVTILADFAEHVSEIGDDVIENAKKRAGELSEKMKNKEDVDFEHFESELERVITRIKIADKWRTKKYRK